MKRTFCILVVVLLSGLSAVNAQIASNKWGLGAHFGTMEINGDYTKQFYSFTQGWAVAASVARYVNPSFDLLGHFFYDRVHGHDQGKSKMPTWMIFQTDMFNLNMLAKYKFNNGYILKEKARLAPYILGGVGGNLSSANGFGEDGALASKKILVPNLYAGLGLSLRITKAISLVAQTSLLLPFTDKIDGITGKVSPLSKSGKDKFLENSVALFFTLGKI